MHEPPRCLPSLYWRSRRDFLLGIHRDQPAGAHVPSWCSRARGGRLVAPDGWPARTA